MRYVVSDIHGNKEAWESIKRKIKFSDNDEMYILGDVIDRGENGIEILMEIMNTCNMHMVLGNHEDMMFNAIITANDYNDTLWYYNGGGPTHRNFNNLARQDQLRILSYIGHLPLQYNLSIPCIMSNPHDVEIYNFYLCHANIKEVYENISAIDFAGDINEFCIWDREYIHGIQYYAKLGKNDIVIHGHTPTIDHDIWRNVGSIPKASIKQHAFHVYGIDCGVAYPELGGRLSCMCLETFADESTWIYSE